MGVDSHRGEIDAAITAGERIAIPFRTGWLVAAADRGQEQNWYFALGSFEVSETGTIVVEPGAPGEPPIIRIEHQTHVFDRYNWDEGKAVTIAGQVITDELLQELHEAGLAQEYELNGSSQTMAVEFSPDQFDAVAPAVQDPGRDGGRGDPTRHRDDARADRDAGRQGRGR